MMLVAISNMLSRYHSQTIVLYTCYWCCFCCCRSLFLFLFASFSSPSSLLPLMLLIWHFLLHRHHRSWWDSPPTSTWCCCCHILLLSFTEGLLVICTIYVHIQFSNSLFIIRELLNIYKIWPCRLNSIWLLGSITCRIRCVCYQLWYKVLYYS